LFNVVEEKAMIYKEQKKFDFKSYLSFFKKNIQVIVLQLYENKRGCENKLVDE